MSFAKLSVLIVISFLATNCAANIAEELTQRANDEATECIDAQNEKQPAFKCSGIIIRGIRLSGGQQFAWSLKSSDKEKNSFAFGFLRRDHPFSFLGKGYDAGFILYPHLKAPSHKMTQTVLCTFPIDARTDMREDRGCGARRNDATGLSRQCDAQNITTFSMWVEHFKKLEEDQQQFAISQCGFDTSKESTAAENFALAMQANAYLQNGTRYAFSNSELRLEGWDENDTKTIPIETFFYFIDTPKGYKNAVKFRDEFYAQSGENVPIVGVRLPTKTNPNIYIKEAK